MKSNMRLFLALFLLMASRVLFAQDAKMIKEINELIGPKFRFDTTNNNGDNFFVIDESSGNMIVTAWDIGLNNTNSLKKIFVLRMSDKKLTIIDTSSTFEVDGRGPDVSISPDTIIIDHGCHGCNFENIYKFNEQKQKYLLVSLKYEEVIKSNKPRYNNVPIGVLEKCYKVNKQEITVEMWNVDENKLKNRKIIKRLLPKDFVPDLAHYIDPMNFNIDAYDKIFKND